MPILDGGDPWGLPAGSPDLVADGGIPDGFGIQGDYTSWMAGIVVSYNNTTGALVVTVTDSYGTETLTDWVIDSISLPGAPSQQIGTSVSSLTSGTGSKSLNTQAGLSSSLTTGDLVLIHSTTLLLATLDSIVDGGSPTGLPYLNDTQQVLYLASREIQDVTNRRWDKIDVLLAYLNMGIMELINLKPDALVVTEDIALDPGAVQAFPVEMIQLIDFISNVSSGGVIGTEISGIKKEFLDQMVPGWMNSTAAASVIFAVVDPKDPHTFYVYPRQPANTTNLLRAKITKQPDEIETIYHELRDLPLDASYQPFLINYITYRVLSEETTIPNAQAKSNDFYNKALQSIGLKTNTEKQVRGEGL